MMTHVHDSGSSWSEGYFEGFAWAVPHAFEAAVAQLRFEPGDVFYRDRSGYDPLEGPLPKGLRAIQVLESAREVERSETGGTGTEGWRRSAWEAELTVERVDLVSGEIESLTVSQGRLFTTLWKGEEGWLARDATAPEPPRPARELFQRLEAAGAAFEARKLPGSRRSGCRFTFVVDESSSASRAKARLVEDALGELVGRKPLEIRTLDPIEAGVDDAERFHPALRIRAIFVPAATSDEIHAALRGVLYGGGSEDDAESADGSPKQAADRFSLTRHGRLDSF